MPSDSQDLSCPLREKLGGAPPPPPPRPTIPQPCLDQTIHIHPHPCSRVGVSCAYVFICMCVYVSYKSAFVNIYSLFRPYVNVGRIFITFFSDSVAGSGRGGGAPLGAYPPPPPPADSRVDTEIYCLCIIPFLFQFSNI